MLGIPRPEHLPTAPSFRPFRPRSGRGCDAVINVTTGGGHGMSLDERTAAATGGSSPELCSLNMGSMNFAIFPMANAIRDFKHDWEPGYLEMTRDYIFRNTFKDIETVVGTLGAHGTRFEFECYDVSHLYSLAHFSTASGRGATAFVQLHLRHPGRDRSRCGKT